MSRTFVKLMMVVGLPVAIAVPRTSTAQRRGSPGTVSPMTDVSITLGKTTVTGRVDADCHVDERATAGSPRAYFVAMYPWFGQRVGPDKPQWRFTLEIRRGPKPEAWGQFAFSFQDNGRSGIIQTVAGNERMGSGTVRVTRNGRGARFDIEGRTKEGDPLRATIDCSAFQRTETPG